MKDQKEIQTAWEIWNLVERFRDLLWDRYDKDFIDISLQEEGDSLAHPLEVPDLPGAEEEVLF